MSGQLALAVSGERVVAAAVWETLPPEIQREVTVRLARLLLVVTGPHDPTVEQTSQLAHRVAAELRQAGWPGTRATDNR